MKSNILPQHPLLVLHIITRYLVIIPGACSTNFHRYPLRTSYSSWVDCTLCLRTSANRVPRLFALLLLTRARFSSGTVIRFLRTRSNGFACNGNVYFTTATSRASRVLLMLCIELFSSNFSINVHENDQVSIRSF